MPSTTSFPRRVVLPLLIGSLLATAVSISGCSDGSERSLTLYSGRNERLIGGLLERFTEKTGIAVEARYGSTAELAATLLEEGERTPADLFLSQDAAALGALSRDGRLVELPRDARERVAPSMQSPSGDWVGLSGRARVVVYNTERMQEDQLPRTLEGVLDPRYSGKFGVAPNNASFQSHMAAYMAVRGEADLKELLEGMAGNEARVYAKNTPIVEAVIAGEIDWGLVNHYYLFRALRENPDAPAKIAPMTDDGVSNFLNLSGIGILQDSEEARELVRFLLSDEAQRYFVEETFEYAVAGPSIDPKLRALDTADFGAVSSSLPRTQALIQDSQLNRFQ